MAEFKSKLTDDTKLYFVKSDLSPQGTGMVTVEAYHKHEWTNEIIKQGTFDELIKERKKFKLN